MIKNMYGFIDPYSLGLIITLFTVIVIQLTDEHKPGAATSSLRYEAVSHHNKQQRVPPLKQYSLTHLSTLEH